MRTVKTFSAALIVVMTVGVLSARADSPRLGEASTIKGPVMFAKAQQTTVKPGGLVTVDVYVANVADLATYQVKLKVAGGESGELAVESGVVDTNRSDYVFGNAQVVRAADTPRIRLGAVQINGSVDVTRPKYIGSFTFRASSDANGAFTIDIVPDTKESFLNAESAERIPFTAGQPVQINAGSIKRKSTRTR